MASRTPTPQQRRVAAILTGITFHIAILSQIIGYVTAQEVGFYFFK